MDDLPSVYPFCVAQFAFHDMSGSVIFDSHDIIRVIFDGTDTANGRAIATKEVYTLRAPQFLCTRKRIANDNQATEWDILREGSQFMHLFTRHDTRPGYADGKSMTTLPAEDEGRDLEGVYTVLLASLPKLAQRSTSEADRIKTGLRTALTILKLEHLIS